MADRMPSDYYDLPPLTDEAQPNSRDEQVIQYGEKALKNAGLFLQSQVGYDRIAAAREAIFAVERSADVSYAPGGDRSKLSDTQANLIAKVAEDVVAELTDTRYFWDYNTKNPAYEPQARLSNDSAEYWYNNRRISERIGDVIRDYTVAGTGFAHLYYSRAIDDMMVEAEDPLNVFPINPLSYHTVQDCAGVIIRRPRNPDWVREEYGKIVSAESSGSGIFGWFTRLIDSPASGGPFTKRDNDQNVKGVPTVYVNTMYLTDRRKNTSSRVRRMGKWDGDNPSTPWSYEVQPGEPLFPFKRLIVWAGRTLLYDDTSPFWHGKFPVIKLTLNPWPRSWFGKAPVWDCLPLQKSINRNLRVIDDHNAQVAQPGVTADRNVSKSQMDIFNTRLPGAKIRTNMSSGKGIIINHPPPLEPIIWETIKWAVDQINRLAGVSDPGAMASLAQIPSDDTIDTIMKAMTPGLRLRSRILEGFYTELSEQFLYCLLEFDSLTKRQIRFGPQGATKEDFDYYPKTMVPDNVPGGDPGDVASMEDSMMADNPHPLWKRGQILAQMITCKFDPSSLLNTAAQQELMKYFLLAKMGYMSVFTLVEKMGIMNFAGPNIKVPADEIGRLQLQAQLGIGMIANAQGRKATDQAPAAMGQSGNGPIIQTS
jgi:hypothetical protein